MGRGRRRVFKGALGLMICLAILPLASYWFVRHHRPSLQAGESYGIDVSHHQGEIDWELVASDGIEFAYIKATEGGDWVDPQFATNWAEAQDAGIEVSAYHFFTNCVSGKDQATNFLEIVPTEQADLPLALDLESVAQCPGVPTPAEMKSDVDDFIRVVEEATGRSLILYVLPEFDAKFNTLANTDNPRWQRSLYRRPGDDEWIIWQYSGTATVAGIQGRTDLNIASGR